MQFATFYSLYSSIASQLTNDFYVLCLNIISYIIIRGICTHMGLKNPKKKVTMVKRMKVVNLFNWPLLYTRQSSRWIVEHKLHVFMSQNENFKFPIWSSCLGLNCKLGLTIVCTLWIAKFSQKLNIKTSCWLQKKDSF